MLFPVAIAFETSVKNQLCIVPSLVEAASREEAIGIGHELAKSAMRKEQELKRLHSVHCGNDTVWKVGEPVREVSAC